jgi:cyclophilin family peptidyl-prolyl cis-trans isomerase
MSQVKITTTKGDMVFQLYDETPITSQNFLKLIENKFYDGLKFHRVIPNFVAQFGCPQGIGTGGPGWTIPCETSAPNQYHDEGVLSMAHRGPNTGGSQVFIVFSRAQTAHLDGKHTCFGKIVSGLDVMRQIAQDDVILSITKLDA